MLYKFIGPDTEVFPTILTADGTLVAEPGQIVELDTDPDHPRLVPVSLSKKELDGAEILDAHLIAEVLEPEPEPGPDPIPDPTTTPED